MRPISALNPLIMGLWAGLGCQSVNTAQGSPKGLNPTLLLEKIFYKLFYINLSYSTLKILTT